MAGEGTYPKCGVTYIAQRLHEVEWKLGVGFCRNCLTLAWNKPLKRCTGCYLVDYCSKDCQKAHWRVHKPFCNMVQGKGKKNGYLSAGDNQKVFRIFIDSYRWRVEVDRSKGSAHGIYGGGDGLSKGSVWVQSDPLADFQRYIDQAETSGILPEWWHFEERMECLALAINRNEKKNIFTPIDEEHDLVSQDLADADIRNTLAILAELVVGYDGTGFQRTNDWYNNFVKGYDATPGEKEEVWRSTKNFADSLKANADFMPRSAIIGAILGLQQTY